MECKSIHKDLIFYLGNELPVGRSMEIQKHLENCNECSEFLSFLNAEMQIIQEEKNPEVSPFFYTRISGRLQEKVAYQIGPAWVRLIQPAFFSLLLVFGIYGGFKIGTSASTMGTNQPEIRSIQMMDDFGAEPIESFLLEQQ
jgi:hypothetical protein